MQRFSWRELGPSMQGDMAGLLQQPGNGPSTHMQRFGRFALLALRGAGGQTMTNKSAPPLDEIELLVGWRAGEDEYLFTKAVAMVREWLLDTEGEDRLRDVL